MASLVAYNVSLSSNSPFFTYHPNRDGDASLTWNSSYTDSNVWPPIANQQEPAGIPYRRTQFASATMSFDYIGSNIYLCLDGNASYNVTLDQVPLTTVHAGGDPTCSDYQAATMVYSSNVKQGNHAVVLTVNSVSSDQELRFFGGTITLGVTSGSAQVRERQIDDQDPGWRWDPGRGGNAQWQSGLDTPDHNMINGTHSWTCIYDEVKQQAATYLFSGAGGVVLRGPIGEGFQVYSVDFDGQTVSLDATSVWPDVKSVPLFMRGGLDPEKQYKITLRNFNSNYPTATQNYYMSPNQHLLAFCANLDGLVLLGDGSGSAPPSGPSSSSTTDPAPQTPPVLSTTMSNSVSATTPGPPSSVTSESITTSGRRQGLSPGSDSGQETATSSPVVPLHKKLATGVIVGMCFGIVVAVITTVCGAFAIFIRSVNARKHAREQADMTEVSAFPQHEDPFEPDYAILPSSTSHDDDPPKRTGKLFALVNGARLSKPSNPPSTPSISVSMGVDSMDPSEIMSATETASTATRLRRRMAPEDLEEVLAFVAQRMDREPDRSRVSVLDNGGSTLPPDYQD